MYTESAKLTLNIPHAMSLKDKRQVSRSIMDKVRQRFNVSASEVDTQDILQTLSIGVAIVSGDAAHAQQSLEAVIRFVEENADAQMLRIERGDW